MIEDDFDLPRARRFGRAHSLGAISRLPFSHQTLAAGQLVDIFDHDPDLPPHCTRAFFFRRVTGRVSAILATRVHPRHLDECRQFAASHGLAIETPSDWPVSVLWLRSPEAIEKEEIERRKEWARQVERDWQIIGRQRLRDVSRP